MTDTDETFAIFTLLGFAAEKKKKLGDRTEMAILAIKKGLLPNRTPSPADVDELMHDPTIADYLSTSRQQDEQAWSGYFADLRRKAMAEDEERHRAEALDVLTQIHRLTGNVAI